MKAQQHQLPAIRRASKQNTEKIKIYFLLSLKEYDYKDNRINRKCSMMQTFLVSFSCFCFPTLQISVL